MTTKQKGCGVPQNSLEFEERTEVSEIPNTISLEEYIDWEDKYGCRGEVYSGFGSEWDKDYITARPCEKPRSEE